MAGSLALYLLAVEAGTRAAVPSDLPAEVPTDADFQALIGKRRAELRRITEDFVNGLIDEVHWAEQTEAILLEGHTRSALMGRQLALQDAVGADLLDLVRGRAAMDAEHDYLHGFLEALEAKDARYWDAEAEAWDADAIHARQASYLGKMRGTANSAFIEESPDEAEIVWHLGGAEDHCTECPEYAALSPFSKDELPTWPGDNDTPCRFNCKCFLTIDGTEGFKPSNL